MIATFDSPTKELEFPTIMSNPEYTFITTNMKPTIQGLTRGFILGKFMPMHKGHVALIEFGAKNCDQLTVMVCSLSTEPINGKLRYEWVKEQFKDFPNVRVVHLEKDGLPQEPSEHPDFWNIWLNETKRLHPEPIDYIFTSEDYGWEYARQLGCQHIQFNQARDIVPVSGTKVRNDPFKYWDYIPAIVKPYFTKKILVIGAESTGKTTLTHNLGDHYNLQGVRTKALPEYARFWIDEEYGGDMDKLQPEDITMFGKRQMELVDFIGSVGYKLVISDTDAIVSSVFQNTYFGYIDDELQRIADAEKWDLILFTQPDIPWVDDGQRNLGLIRTSINEIFRHELDKRGMKYVVVSGSDWAKRFDIAKKAIDNIISSTK